MKVYILTHHEESASVAGLMESSSHTLIFTIHPLYLHVDYRLEEHSKR